MQTKSDTKAALERLKRKKTELYQPKPRTKRRASTSSFNAWTGDPKRTKKSDEPDD